MRIEVVFPADFANRTGTKKILSRCVKGTKFLGHSFLVEKPSKGADLIVLWGLGHPTVEKYANDALDRGRHFVCWDLAYWQRDTKYRVSVDEMHPDKIVMYRDRENSKWTPELKDDGDPNGPILLAGMGWKSARWYKELVGEWETKTARELQLEFPDKKIYFRPKPGNPLHCQSVEGLENEYRPIEEAIKGKSLVVVRHSNVAIDGIIAGVPFRTVGGAAKAIESMPFTPEIRQKFLTNLSWFQYSQEEMMLESTWRIILEMLEDMKNVKKQTPQA